MSELERQLTEALKTLSEQYEREQRIARGPNPGMKSANYLQGRTICVSCRWTGPCWTGARKRENRVGMAGLPTRSDCPLRAGSPGMFGAPLDQPVLQCVHPSRPLGRLESRTSLSLPSPSRETRVCYGRLNHEPPPPIGNLVSGHATPC